MARWWLAAMWGQGNGSGCADFSRRKTGMPIDRETTENVFLCGLDIGKCIFVWVRYIGTCWCCYGKEKVIPTKEHWLRWSKKWRGERGVILSSVANTAAKPRNWATFDPVLTTKNGCAAVWQNISYTYLYGLWSGTAVWEVNAPRFGEIFVGNTDFEGQFDVCNRNG